MSSILKVNTIQDGGGNAIITSDGSGTFTPGSLNIANAQIASNAAIATTKLGTGAVMQVVSTTKTDTFATNPSSSFIDVTGLSVSITPSSTSSKVLINISISGGGSTGVNIAHFRLLRGSTVIYAGDSSSSRTLGFTQAIDSDANASQNSSGVFLDSPSTTSATTYKIQTYSNGIVYINRSKDDSNDPNRSRNASTILAMEVAG